MSEYRCVRCGRDGDFERLDHELRCPNCNTSYQVVDGHIPVFIDDPSSAANYYGPMFREEAGQYESRYKVESEHGRWGLRRLVELEPGILKLSGGTLLEIGAGTGPLTRALEEGVPLSFRKLYVSDISAEMLRVNWRQRAVTGEATAVEYLCCNVLKTPFPDSSIDLVIGMDVLHHILNYPRALAEIQRILRPGGVCVLKEPHRDAYRFLVFLSRALLSMNRRRRLFSGLTRRDRALIAGWQAHALRIMELADRGEHEALAQLDDKYFFDPKHLAREALEVGFARLSECNVLYRPAEHIPVGPMYMDHFKGLGVSPRGLKEVERACADVDSTIGQFLLEHAPINTLFLAWKRP